MAIYSSGLQNLCLHFINFSNHYILVPVKDQSLKFWLQAPSTDPKEILQNEQNPRLS